MARLEYFLKDSANSPVSEFGVHKSTVDWLRFVSANEGDNLPFCPAPRSVQRFGVGNFGMEFGYSDGNFGGNLNGNLGYSGGDFGGNFGANLNGNFGYDGANFSNRNLGSNPSYNGENSDRNSNANLNTNFGANSDRNFGYNNEEVSEISTQISDYDLYLAKQGVINLARNFDIFSPSVEISAKLFSDTDTKSPNSPQISPPISGEIRKFTPEILIVVDAMSGFSEGETQFFDLSDEVSYIYSTHDLPVPVLISYLRSICKNIFFLGISVLLENVLDFNEGLSEGAKRSAKIAVEKIKNLDKNLAG